MEILKSVSLKVLKKGSAGWLLGVLLPVTAGEVDKATMHNRVGSGDRRHVTEKPRESTHKRFAPAVIEQTEV